MSSLARAAAQVRVAVGLGQEGDSMPGEPPWWHTSWLTTTLLSVWQCVGPERATFGDVSMDREKLLFRKTPKRP